MRRQNIVDNVYSTNEFIIRTDVKCEVRKVIRPKIEYEDFIKVFTFAAFVENIQRDVAIKLNSCFRESYKCISYRRDVLKELLK